MQLAHNWTDVIWKVKSKQLINMVNFGIKWQNLQLKLNEKT